MNTQNGAHASQPSRTLQAPEVQQYLESLLQGKDTPPPECELCQYAHTAFETDGVGEVRRALSLALADSHFADQHDLIRQVLNPPPRVFRSGAELLELPPVEWILKIDDKPVLNRGGITVVSADAGVGKTLITLGWACQLALAGNRVAFFAMEAVSSVRDRYAAWLDYHGHSAPLPNLMFHWQDDDAPPFDLSIDGIPNAFREHGQSQGFAPDILILDPLVDTLGAIDENDNPGMARAIKSLRGLAKSVVVNHHVAKGHGKVRGASSVKGVADTLIELKAKDNGAVVGSFDKFRHGAKPAELVYRIESHAPAAIAKVSTETIVSDGYSKVVQAIQGGADTQAIIRDETGLAKSTVSDYVVRAKDDGLVAIDTTKNPQKISWISP